LSEVRQYLNASDAYFKRKRVGRAVSMDFRWPAIAGACPVCGGQCGAIYRGYYRRGVICPSALFVGFVAVRTGFCKARRKRFALFPEFLIPFRSFSRAAFDWLWRAWREQPAALGAAVDRWFDGFEREISLSISTLESQLRFILRQLHAGHLAFGIPPLAPGPASCGLNIPLPIGLRAVNHLAFGAVASLRIDPPP
jgi:hypothetical protein